MFSDVEVHDTPAVVCQDEEDVQDAKGRGRHDEEVDRGQRAEVVVEKRAPSLRGWLAWPRRHEAGHTSLADVDAKLEQFAVDFGCAPEWIGLMRDGELSWPGPLSITATVGKQTDRMTAWPSTAQDARGTICAHA